MASSLSWLDHDAAAAGRSMQMLSLFNQPEARDELGIGGVRDAIADQLFPGTSTIQTRLRYAFFIPWLFGQLEENAVSASAFPGAAKEAENRLLAELIANLSADEKGVIGRESGSALKRMPSSVYWAGLGNWGFRNVDASISQFFSQVERRRAQQRLPRGSEHDEKEGRAAGAWHAKLSTLRPKGFPEGATLALEREEAALLLDQWKLRHPDSLLAWLAIDLTGAESLSLPDQIWQHVGLLDFPERLRELVLDAQRFDKLIHGAARLYNLQLAELEGRDELVAEHGAALANWQEDRHLLRSFELDDFWMKVMNKGHSINDGTRGFVKHWLEMVSDESLELSTSIQARDLIRVRERRLKGNRSRFDNPSARRQWGGYAGLSPLTYRWPVAREFLTEWHLGWSKS